MKTVRTKSILPYLIIVVILITRKDDYTFFDTLLSETFLQSFYSNVENILLIITAILAIIQLSASKRIARASFLVDLNNTYICNPDYMELYTILQKCQDGKCKFGQQCEALSDDKVHCYYVDNIEKVQISNYLTFFETLYLLYKSKVVSLKVLDDLFAYRFFLAIHSPLFKQSKLEAQPANFSNIYNLELKWMEYRKKHKNDSEESVYIKGKLKR